MIMPSWLKNKVMVVQSGCLVCNVDREVQQSNDGASHGYFVA
jgi:hypothetical protein